MIIKGGSVSPGHGNNLANYLLRDRKNESAELIQLRGCSGKTLDEAVQEWSLISAGTRCKLPIYSASLNPQAHEKLTRAQYERAADILEDKLGLTGQPRAIVLQIHEGREHAHVLWSRISIDRMRAISDSNNFRKHELAARAIEREFGLQRVKGAHIEREPGQRPNRTPTQAELQQGQRGVPPREAKQIITELWRGSDSAQAFKAALEDKGWLLARGDRRDFVLIDPFSTVHSLARRVEGARAADIRTKLADLDRDLLPSVAEARQIMRERNPALSRISPARHLDQNRQADIVAPTPTPLQRVKSFVPHTPARKVPSRAGVKLAGKMLDGLASLFEGLLGGTSSRPQQDAEPAHKREAEPIPHQQSARDAESERAREQSIDDLAHRRQEWTREWQETPPERMADADIQRRQQRERDDRGRSR